MKLTQLEYFRAVCKHNNISKAAEELHITQPSVSNAIKDLESEFGVNLFHRHNNRISLTKEGEYFLDKANTILELSADLSLRMKDFGNEKNNIKIGVPPMIGTFLFPSMFQSFKELYPDIDLEIVENSSPQTRKLVLDDQLDMAIIILEEDDSLSFHTNMILDTQVEYCVSPIHKFAERPVIDISEIQKEPLVMLGSGYFLNQAVQNQFDARGIKPNIVLCSNQIYTIKSFVTKNIATSFLFKEIIENDKEMIGIPLTNTIKVSIGLIWKLNKYMYSDAIKFIRFTERFKSKHHQ